MPTRERRLAAEARRKAKEEKLDGPKSDDAPADGEQEPVEKFRKDPDDTLTNEDKIGGRTQLRLAGQERKTNKRLEDAAEKVDQLQTKRLNIQKKEAEARAELKKVMQELGVEQYDLPDDMEAVIDKSEKAKVHKKKKQVDDD